MTTAARCRSCRAWILWVQLRSGKKMPLDYVPSVDGNIIVENGFARVLGAVELSARPAGERRHTSHFATCPQAAKFRRPT